MPVIQSSSTVRSSNSGTTAQTCTFSSPWTVGSTLFLVAGNYSGAGINEPTDSAGNLWTLDGEYPIGTNNKAYIFRAENTGTGGATPTISFTPTTSSDNYISARAIEISEVVAFLNIVAGDDSGPNMDPGIFNSSTSGSAFALSVLTASADTANLGVAAGSVTTLVDVCQTTVDFTGYVAGYSYSTANPVEHHYTANDSYLFQGIIALYEYTPGGSTEYTITPSGGVVFGGAPAFIRNRALLPTGGVVFGGAPAITFNKNYVITASGGVTFAGAPPILRERSIVPAGGISFSGTGTFGFDRVISPSGGAVFGGTGNIIFEGSAGTTYLIEPSGGISFSGAADVLRERSITPNGGITFSGASTLQREKSIIPSGGIIFDGTAPFIGDHIVIPNGGVIFGGNGGMYFAPAGGSGLIEAQRLNVKISKAMGL